MNKVILKGRLTSKPEIKIVGEHRVSQFVIAINRKYQKDKTDFIPCKAWNKTGELIEQYFEKGQEILVTGSIQIDKTEKGYFTSINIAEFEFCGSLQKKHDMAAENENYGNDAAYSEVTDGDVPF